MKSSLICVLRRGTLLLALLMLSPALLASCGKIYASPAVIIDALCSLEAGLPAGTVYFSEADEGSKGYLPPEMLSVTYGVPESFDGIEKAAVRPSGTGHPCEFAVFLCTDPNAAEDVALFCTQRIESLLKNARAAAALCNMSYEDYTEYVKGATVTVSGRYVALIISSDPKEAGRAFIRAT